MHTQSDDGAAYDLVVVGGGINGAGIARDAAGRGYKVLLVEKDDLASATSSASTKLIHGGLRYLEYAEFRLVREALIEREVLLRAAPHIIWPLRFVLPHSRDQRPAWLIRLGLFIYDHLGGRQLLPGCETIRLAQHAVGPALKSAFAKAFVYSDCWVQDSRLVVLNALDAAERGAEIRTRTECVEAQAVGDNWRVVLLDRDSGERFAVTARVLINATGPWVNEVLAGRLGKTLKKRVRMVKGSHIVVPRIFDHDYPYIFQSSDGRIVFAIPYEKDFTLIGTTDEDFEGDPGEAANSEGETVYLCSVVNEYLRQEVKPSQVVWSYSGVRPLYDDAASSASAATRDYVFDVEGGKDQPILLSVFGGKITTYRKLAEHALEKLEQVLGRRSSSWTAGAVLPGGDIPGADFEAALAGFQADYPWLPKDLARRYFRNYGTRARRLIGDAKSPEALGVCLGGDLYAAELLYLVEHEWVRTAEDLLWRRSKLGLHLDDRAKDRVNAWLEENRVTCQSPARFPEAAQ